MKQFKEAYKLLKEDLIIEDFNKLNDYHYLIKKYPFRYYLKHSTWFSQCGCKLGIISTPNIICKHHIVFVIKEFLKQNKLKLIKDE